VRTRIAYAGAGALGGHHYHELYVAGVDRGKPVRVTGVDLAYDGSPAWSPDGKRIAFTHSTGDRSVIDVVDADGDNRETLTTDPAPRRGSDFGPTWSPDGKQIAFARATSDGHGWTWAAIYVVDADGGNERLLVDHALDPAWSPDGRQILFTKYRRSYGSSDDCVYSCGIYVVNADSVGRTPAGRGIRRLQASGPLDTSPAWSPDGDEIVFMSTRDARKGWVGERELYVMDADGTNVRRLTTNRVGEGEPDWR
jgi:TolB protein